MASRFFEGRLVLVTGGGSGIGRCVCHALAREGSRVIVADIDLNAAEATLGSLPGTNHIALQVDVGESKSVTALFESISKLCSQPASIVINCAGMGMKTTDLVDLTEKCFDDIIRVNTKGTFLVNQAAARAMTAGSVRDGAIVNIASLEATQCSPGWSAYAAAKAGVVALTKVAAKELASLGIRVNCVLPTVTDTPMSAPGKHTEERKKLLESIPLKRSCRPEEVTEVILFLCGPGSSFMTGAAVDISGGL
ncbi:(3R)-3-hydroxyacyl-CoA dehydrogenase [Ixodes scapularis]|uniref:(3R)-3-hydroxyacyl-CoA dehydrogenase n=1 Tax=Ixodes scapularis TaxID=6945 RepID=UPI001A9D5DCF|nr:(3R)-3-hydroxyacyl-CoA dehydrogenase [Ixodes scapularis]